MAKGDAGEGEEELQTQTGERGEVFPYIQKKKVVSIRACDVPSVIFSGLHLPKALQKSLQSL